MLITACDKSSSSSDENDTIHRTVIVYIAGENNLDELGILNKDINEMVKASADIPKNDRLVVFVDASPRRTTPYIAEIKDGVCDTIHTYGSDFYSCDPVYFKEAIGRIEQAYPSEEYGLVLWGHATSWLVTADSVASYGARQSGKFKAYGVDDDNNLRRGVKWMNITQMSKSLESFSKFKFIMADCCCFMSIETAYQLRHATEYLIGSPAEVPDEGAPFDAIIKYFYTESSILYKGIIDNYYDYYLKVYQDNSYGYPSYLRGYSVPLSVVDMKHIEDLASATRALLKTPGEYDMEHIPYYYHEDLPVCYDMAGLIEKTCTAEEFESWKKVFDRAVPYRRQSERWMTIFDQIQDSMIAKDFHFNADGYNAISMFVPQPFYEQSDYYLYNDGIRNFDWYYAVGWDRFDAQ